MEKFTTSLLLLFLSFPGIAYAQTPTPGSVSPQAGNPWGASPYTTAEIATQARYLYDTFAAPFMLLLLGAVAFIVVIGAVLSVYRGAAKK